MRLWKLPLQKPLQVEALDSVSFSIFVPVRGDAGATFISFRRMLGTNSRIVSIDVVTFLNTACSRPFFRWHSIPASDEVDDLNRVPNGAAVLISLKFK